MSHSYTLKCTCQKLEPSSFSLSMVSVLHVTFVLSGAVKRHTTRVTPACEMKPNNILSLSPRFLYVFALSLFKFSYEKKKKNLELHSLRQVSFFPKVNSPYQPLVTKYLLK